MPFDGNFCRFLFLENSLKMHICYLWVIFCIFVPQERDKMTILLLIEMLKAIANGEQHFS